MRVCVTAGQRKRERRGREGDNSVFNFYFHVFMLFSSVEGGRSSSGDVLKP